MFKTIIFDLGGVYFTDGTKRAIDIISKQYHLPENKVKDVLKGELGTKYRIGTVTADEFWRLGDLLPTLKGEASRGVQAAMP